MPLCHLGSHARLVRLWYQNHPFSFLLADRMPLEWQCPWSFTTLSSSSTERQGDILEENFEVYATGLYEK
ncbi:Uncharacterized protein FKW44_025287 [Caligus rogercresseyi]|uniref:Uncharacterized protein n=1 Tax=Caligus rogercresseyi TaxID=217165 RepID=A0A7T8GKL3_CALRO|nr:Uncharacterized protein FKW44_025287 [Caligus rogercresseyi]